MSNIFLYSLISFMMCLAACREERQAPAPVSYGYDSPVTIIEAQTERVMPVQIEKIITVEQGQNLASIAQQFKVPQDEIIILNELKSPYFVYPGQNLKIPDPSQFKNYSEELVENPKYNIEKESEKEVIETSKSCIKEEKESSFTNKVLESLEDDPILVPLPMPARRKLSIIEREKSLENQFQTLEKKELGLSVLPKKDEIEEQKTKKEISQNSEEEKISQLPKKLSEKSEDERKMGDLLLKDLKSDMKDINSETDSSASLQEKKSTSAALKFKWPVEGKVVSSFNQEEGKIKNDGINISAPKGSPIIATAEGVVVYVGNEIEGFGNLVLIKHAAGWMSSYGHCQKILVKRGQRVKQGTQIALVGNTGSVHKPELHFELRKESTKLDPMLYLD